MKINFDELFQTIETLVMLHSPSGAEQEIDRFLLEQFAGAGRTARQDAAGNIIVTIEGRSRDGALAITAHKDEIGALVKSIDPNGQVAVRKLGGAFPWVYGEGVVDLMGDEQTLSGILSFGSRHVSHESPQKAFQDDAPLRWQDVWIETGKSKEQLAAAGIRPGTRVVVGKHRKRPLRMEDYVASYTLDNKASLAILLILARSLDKPAFDVHLVASANEEVGAIGASYYAARAQMDRLVALEICPVSREYPIKLSDAPVVLSQDGYGLYDETLNARLRDCAAKLKVPIQNAVIGGFGSDASIAMKHGHIAQGACLGFPTQNTHGFEIAHLGAIANCARILHALCRPAAGNRMFRRDWESP